MIATPRRHASGFTLIEVLVALAMSSAVVLMVHQAFAQVIDGTARLEAVRVGHSQTMQMNGLLAAAFGSLEVGTPGTLGFEGSPHAVSFSAVLGSQATEPVPVRIVAVRGWLILQSSARSDSLTAEQVSFEYLLSQGSESSWVHSWHSPASSPIAVRLRVRRDSLQTDTLLFVIGTRG